MKYFFAAQTLWRLNHSAIEGTQLQVIRFLNRGSSFQGANERANPGPYKADRVHLNTPEYEM